MKRKITGTLFLIMVMFSSFALAQEIRDVKPPQGFPFPWLVFLIVLFVIVLAVFVYILFAPERKKQTLAAAPPLKAWEAALLRLKELQNKGYLAKGEFHTYYSELSDILRHYIEDRFAIDAPERTTEEFLVYMREVNVLTGAQKNMLKNFLTECDKVKFAKFSPTVEDGQWAFGIAKSFIEETVVRENEERLNAA